MVAAMSSYCISWMHHFERFTIATMTWLTVTEYKWQRICPAIHFPILCNMTRCITRISWRMPLVKQKQLTLRITCYHPGSWWGSYLAIVSILYSVLYIIVTPVVNFLLAIVFVSVALRIVITLLVSSNSFNVYNVLQTKY